MGAGNTTFLLKVGDCDVEVTRKKVKGFRMRVGRDGKVKLSAPRYEPLASIEAFVFEHHDWIEQARAKVSASPYDSELCDGGTIMIWGEPLAIRVVRAEKRSKAAYVDGDELVVTLSPAKCNAEGIRDSVNAFLAAEVKRELELSAVPRMEAVTGAHASSWRVRAMSSRWGSCNTRTHAITINSRLAHYPRRCLDYVVCHELCHILEPSHNARFHALMDRFYPGWKAVKKELG